ncbi:hypothetical protein [Bordetella genomosp. 9]|uniref:hypothetical protein n=1 Tax=Bordetella genomosp. 9 TaxID=1416803 RepID=UPI0012FC7C22|nr:hypothetical protein [Bordetella genomosp. 9]
MTPDMREMRRLGGFGNRFRRLAGLVAALDCRNRLRQSLQADRRRGDSAYIAEFAYRL